MWGKTITVLGSPNSYDGLLSTQSIDRTVCALELWKTDPGSKFILTGGFGEQFNCTSLPHTYYLKDFLIANGVPTQEIIAELPSTNTMEDIKFLHNFLTFSGDLGGCHIIVTSTFHAKRVDLIIKRFFSNLEKPLVIGAPDSLPKNVLRELIQYEKAAIGKLLEKTGEST